MGVVWVCYDPVTTLKLLWVSPTRTELSTCPFSVLLLIRRLYIGRACPRVPCVAIQLYGAIHYTAIQRYTLYNLYNTPLAAPGPGRGVSQAPVRPASWSFRSRCFCPRARERRADTLWAAHLICWRCC